MKNFKTEERNGILPFSFMEAWPEEGSTPTAHFQLLTPPPNLGFPPTVLSLHFLISHFFEESNPMTHCQPQVFLISLQHPGLQAFSLPLWPLLRTPLSFEDSNCILPTLFPIIPWILSSDLNLEGSRFYRALTLEGAF